MPLLSKALSLAQKRAEESGVELSLVIEDLSSGEKRCLKENMVHSSASVIKVPLMMAVLEDAGKDFLLTEKISLDKINAVAFSVVTEIGEGIYTINEYLSWMIMESCNASTNVLIDLVGMERVNRIFSDLAMEQTILQRKMMDVEARKAGKDNLTSAQDMATILRKIYHREYFSEAACERGLQLMKKCRSDGLLLRYLTDPPVFAHKSGGLDEVSHDVGIFFRKKDLLVSAMSTNISSEENDPKRTTLLGHLGRWLLKEE